MNMSVFRPIVRIVLALGMVFASVFAPLDNGRRLRCRRAMMTRQTVQFKRCIISTLIGGATLAVFVILPTFSRAQVSAPDTPAGRTLQVFLDSLNSGDHDRIGAYVKEYEPQNNADQLTSFSRQTGGFTLMSIVNSTPERLTFLVKGRGDHLDAYGVLQLASTAPPRVERLTIRAFPPGAKFDDIKLDNAARLKTIEAIGVLLTDYYVYPDVAAKMIERVQERAAHGDYNSITDGNDFAAALARDLRAVSDDKHLFVTYKPFTSPRQPDSAQSGGSSPGGPAMFRASLEQQNCAFSKLEILNHNIGLIKFDAFLPPDICGPTVVAAMSFLAHTDALIFDLRENQGGDPEMVEFMVSYLFQESTHINDLANRHDNETRQYWTLPWLPGPRFSDKPVYVLTSQRTFSGGEEFTFDLKTQKRATIVGETTGGGAHPVQGFPAGDHFTIGVPYAHPINPVTKGDWEGTGVEPDVKVSAADALATAEKLAVDKLVSQSGSQ